MLSDWLVAYLSGQVCQVRVCVNVMVSLKFPTAITGILPQHWPAISSVISMVWFVVLVVLANVGQLDHV